MSKLKLSTFFVPTLALFIVSCASIQPQKEMESVAKNWSMTIRASQVIPIYPLEEDIRPGDVYLITNSIDSEIESWTCRGFLPLNNRYARIPIPQSEYDRFFENAPGSASPPSFNRHPVAAFPSYSFSVDQRGAFGLAIPLSSVPVALSMSGARDATGSVVLSGVRTLGLPDFVIDTHVYKWAKNASVKKALMEKARATENPLLLRAISRVYSVSGATVSLTFQQAGGTTMQAGAPPAAQELIGASQEDFDKRIEQLNQEIELEKSLSETAPVEIPPISSSEPSSNPQIAALEAELAQVQRLRHLSYIRALRRNVERGAMIDQFGGFILPGGAGRVTVRTASGVSMQESFNEPLVVGYWATEYLVYEDGSLLSLGGLKHLVDNPEDYRSKVELTRKFMGDPTQEPEVYKPGMKFP